MAPPEPSQLNDKERRLVGLAPVAVDRGDQLLDWWKDREAAGSLQKFPLVPKRDSPHEMLGFYDTMELDGKPSTVMGCLQTARYRRASAGGSDDRRGLTST